VGAPTQGATPRVVISHATEDRTVAVKVCASLEEAGIPCWMAPRDIVGGHQYGEAIIAALEACPAVLLLLSRASNKSRWVSYEIENAASTKRTIIPFRLEDVKPSRPLRLFVGSLQWIDGFPGPWQSHLEPLLAALRPGPATAADSRVVAEDAFWGKANLSLPVLDDLKDERRLLRFFLLAMMVVAAPAMLVGAVTLTLGTVTLGLSLLLPGGCVLPAAGWLYHRQLQCADYVGVLKVAVHLKDEGIARQAIKRLKCFPTTKELFDE
jgi:TIR domain-containing protein